MDELQTSPHSPSESWCSHNLMGLLSCHSLRRVPKGVRYIQVRTSLWYIRVHTIHTLLLTTSTAITLLKSTYFVHTYVSRSIVLRNYQKQNTKKIRISLSLLVLQYESGVCYVHTLPLVCTVSTYETSKVLSVRTWSRGTIRTHTTTHHTAVNSKHSVHSEQ